MSLHHLSVAVAVDAYTLTPGRIVGSVASLIALAGVIVGGIALARSRTTTRAPVIALLAGPAGALTGALVVAAADGGPGTGYGIVGGYVALVLGLTATVLGGLALARARHRPSAATKQP
jgi:hypothetical protein